MGAQHPLGQGPLGIVDLVAQLIPDLWQFVAAVAGVDFHLDFRAPGQRLRFYDVDLLHLLDGALQTFGDLFFHFNGGGAGVGRVDDGVGDGEGGVFEFAHRIESPDTAQQADHHDQPGIERPFDGQLGDVHGGS